MKLAGIVLALCSLIFVPNALAQSHHSHHSSSTKSHSTKSHSSRPKKSNDGTVHVHGYYRKDGTYVSPYDRRAPGTASSSSNVYTPHTYKKDHMAEGFTPHSTVQYDKHGKIKRSKAARSEFQREHPCPSTGKTSGSCPGYVVDHVNALECSGADSPSNMQWQTVADAKAKDKTERACRQ